MTGLVGIDTNAIFRKNQLKRLVDGLSIVVTGGEGSIGSEICDCVIAFEAIHPDMVRYFMTIRKACDLVLRPPATRSGLTVQRLPSIVLNMGQPVKIVDLPRRMIQLSELEPERDIDIVFSGVRPEECMHKILFAREERTSDIGIAGVMAAKPVCPSLSDMSSWIVELENGARLGQRSVMYKIMQAAVPGFQSEAAE